MKIRIFLTLLLLFSNCVFATPMPIVFPFLLITPEKNTVNVINARTVAIKYTVVNNLSYWVSNITVAPDFGVTSDFVAISVDKNTCSNDVGPGASCSFDLILHGKNQTGSLIVSPRLCFFIQKNCSVPLPQNMLRVSAKVLRSISVGPEKSVIEINKTQSLSAIGEFSDNTKADMVPDVVWHSSNNNVASVDPKTGIANGVAPGSANISANYDDITSNSAIITVTKKE